MNLQHLRLFKGAHKSPSEGACVMELVSHVMGCGWTDSPPCTSPALAAFCRNLNDNLSDEDRQRLLPYLARIAGAKGTDEQELMIGYIGADYCVRIFCPAVIEARDPSNEWVGKLRALDPIRDSESAARAAGVAGAAGVAWVAWVAGAAGVAGVAGVAWVAGAAEAAGAKARMIDLQFECLEAMLAVFETTPDAEQEMLDRIKETGVPEGLPVLAH